MLLWLTPTKEEIKIVASLRLTINNPRSKRINGDNMFMDVFCEPVHAEKAAMHLGRPTTARIWVTYA